ncbi:MULTISPECIES: DUF4321 domain-containing protein [unclassified Fusibacter]|uniref:DUF4321 domain-containing protein n=1 Tax=unclassified Fusibacter TaxID=2624464 RepID=UPI001012E04E|nr:MULTISPECIES: DUF4321 domain-containing protein [unclassified Fusibacter]MCK8060665.1 DUF4321 domain-containing protein [Fusibacter sp. A2]NPE22881.1 DUF4321 domain-containing protein [Fusibacter sp. A1]RXV59949.1 DUF4321 domain-containing protein [Fusibacter sp. A1]
MKKNPIVLLVFMLVGLVIGGIIGDLLGGLVPVLNYSKSIGVDPFTLDMAIMTLTLGFRMTINLAGVIGLLIGLFIYSKF